MDLLCTRRVDPVGQFPRSEMYGYFTHGTDPPFRPYSLPSSVFPTAFAVLLVLFSRPTTDRALLAISLSLIGPLTPVPPEDPASPPEVTRCSSVPSRPQTPWCGG